MNRGFQSGLNFAAQQPVREEGEARRRQLRDRVQVLGPRVRDVRGHQEVEGQRQGSADRQDGGSGDRCVAGVNIFLQCLLATS